MKLRIYFRPWIAVLLLGIAAAVLWWATIALEGATIALEGATFLLGGGVRLLVLLLAILYSALFVVAAWALGRSLAIERWIDWDRPARLLILAPHEDDCVISAGGIAVRNRRLGGATRVVYLAPDETPGLAEIRAGEARAAWREAGVDAGDLRHLDLLPPLRQRDPQRLRGAVKKVRTIIDDFKPTAVVVPMFEGGHIHHDMIAALLGSVVTAQDRFEVFEAPEYSPYASLAHTPHRVIALCARWLFLVAYYGPPDGIDGRSLLKVRLDPEDLACKRRMLAAFVSQNAPSLVATRAYPDRLVRWDAGPRRHPFVFARSYLRFVLAARRLVGPAIVDRVFPVQPGTIGRDGTLTDWQEEWAGDAAPSLDSAPGGRR